MKDIDLIRARFLQRKLARLDEANYDDETEGEESEETSPQSTQTFHGNTRLPFGLCKGNGIKIGDNWTPKDAWNALKGIGVYPDSVFKKVGEIKKSNDDALASIKNAVGNSAKKSEAKKYLNTLEDGDTLVIKHGKKKRKITVVKNDDSVTFEEKTDSGIKTRDADKMAMHLVNCVTKYNCSVKTKKNDLKIPKGETSANNESDNTKNSQNTLPPLEDEPEDLYAAAIEHGGFFKGLNSFKLSNEINNALNRYKAARDSNRLSEYKGDIKKIVDVPQYSKDNGLVMTGKFSLGTTEGTIVFDSDLGWGYIPKDLSKEPILFSETLTDEIALKAAEGNFDDNTTKYNSGKSFELYKNKECRKKAATRIAEGNYKIIDNLIWHMDDGEAIELDVNGSKTYIEKANGKFVVYGNRYGVIKGGQEKSIAKSLRQAFWTLKNNNATSSFIDSKDIPASAKAKPKPQPKPSFVAKRQAVQGNDITSKYVQGAFTGKYGSKYKYRIYDVCKQQGYDGLPTILGAKEFSEALTNDHLICVRGVDSSSKDVLAGFRDDLYNGEFFINGYGGTAYGAGLYCASSAMKNQTGLKYAKNGAYSGQQEIFTFTADAKIIDSMDLMDMYLNEPADVQDKFHTAQYGDLGSYGAAKGFDVINHGTWSGGSDVTTILNRTKMIILDPKDSLKLSKLI